MAALVAIVEELRGETAPAERFDPRRAGVQQIGNPRKQRSDDGKGTPDGQGRGVRGRIVGHGVLDRAGRRRRRGDDLGAPRGGLRRHHRPAREHRLPPRRPAAAARSPPPTTPRRRVDGAEAVVFAVPSQSFRANLDGVGPDAARDVPFVSLMKGVELGSLKRMSEVIGEVTGAGAERIAVVSGPNLSHEIATREPAASVVACADEDVAKRLQDMCHSTAFRPYTSRRRARLRARRRLQERRRAGRRHGRRPRASATTPRPRSSPAAWPRPPGSRPRSAPTR